MTDAPTNGTNEVQSGPQTNTEEGQPLTFDLWLAGQPPEVKNLIEERTNGLKSALDSERLQRKDFEKKLRDAAKKLEEGSESRKALEDMAGKLSNLEKQASFFDAAHSAGATNLRLAFLAAQESGLLDGDVGKIDFERFKADFPELFSSPKTPPGHAGTGTQHTPAARSMNDFIRTSAGRR